MGDGRRKPRKTTNGFTLIELFVALSVVGLLMALSLPRYLAARWNILGAEADHVLNELRTLGWGYYQQYGTWVGLTDANMSSVLGFQPPDDAIGCWDYGLAGPGTATQLAFQASGDDTPIKCFPVDGGTVTLTINTDGTASRSQSLP